MAFNSLFLLHHFSFLCIFAAKMEKKENTGKVFLIAGSEPLGSAGVQADIKAITRCGGWAAAALKVSAATRMTDFPSFLSLYASFAMEVVFPTPLTPMTKMIKG